MTLSPEQEQLLRLFRTQGNMSRACKIAGCEGFQHYKWILESDEYCAAYQWVSRDILDNMKGKFHKGDGDEEE